MGRKDLFFLVLGLGFWRGMTGGLGLGFSCEVMGGVLLAVGSGGRRGLLPGRGVGVGRGDLLEWVLLVSGMGGNSRLLWLVALLALGC